MSAVPDVLKAGSDCEKGRGLADLALEAVVELRARPARLPAAWAAPRAALAPLVVAGPPASRCG